MIHVVHLFHESPHRIETHKHSQQVLIFVIRKIVKNVIITLIKSMNMNLNSWTVVNPDSSIEKWALFSRLKSGCPIHVSPIAKDAADA